MHHYSFFYFTLLPYTTPKPNSYPNLTPALIYNVSNYTPQQPQHVTHPLEPIRSTADRQSPHQQIQAPRSLPYPPPLPDLATQQVPNWQEQGRRLVVDKNVYKYAKKNAESNLINQIFSYISTPSKSKHILLRVVKEEEKAKVFYGWMGQLKLRNKKYINRKYICDLMAVKRSHIIYGILQKNKDESLITIPQLKAALNTLVFHYLAHTCTLTLLTSTKLDRYSLHQHLQRRRDIMHYLRNNLARTPSKPH